MQTSFKESLETPELRSQANTFETMGTSSLYLIYHLATDALPARRQDRINALHPAICTAIRCHQMHFARIRMADGKFPIVLQLAGSSANWATSQANVKVCPQLVSHHATS